MIGSGWLDEGFELVQPPGGHFGFLLNTTKQVCVFSRQRVC